MVKKEIAPCESKKRFNLNGSTLGFCPRTQTSELPYETPSFLLKVGIYLGFWETAHLPLP